MKKHPRYDLMILGLLIVPVAEAMQETAIRTEFQPTPRVGTDALKPSDLDHVKVFLEVAPTQRDPGRGIRAIVDIVNEGSRSIQLRDPTEVINTQGKGVRLTGRVDIQLDKVLSEGTPTVRVDLPPPLPRGALFQTGDPRSYKARWDERGPFFVIAVDRPTHGVGVKSVQAIADGQIVLEPGEQFQFVVSIAQIMNDPQRYWADVARRKNARSDVDAGPIEPPKPVPIPLGNYLLSVSVFLETAGSPDETAYSGRLSGPVSVHLGPEGK